MTDSQETGETGATETQDFDKPLSERGEISMQGPEEMPENPYNPEQFDASQISGEDVEYFGECRRISNLPAEEQWAEWEQLTSGMSSKELQARSLYTGASDKGVYIYPPWGDDVFFIQRPKEKQ